MIAHLRRSIVSILVFTAFFGFVYAFAGTGISQLLFGRQADGSITSYGSTLIGQNWSLAKCPGHPLGSCVFHGRPDDTGPYAADPRQGVSGGDNPLEANGVSGVSGATNLGPRSKVLLADTEQLVAYWHRLGVDPTPDLVTTSGSGYDPDITPQDATVQIPMISKATGIPASSLAALVKMETHGEQLGFLGSSDNIDVLQLNKALARLKLSSFELTDATTWARRPVARRIADAIPRARLVVSGTIRSVDTIAVGGGNAFRCVVSDGTGDIELLFLGRRSIPGLEPGTICSVEGVAGTREARLVLRNPDYRLGAGRELLVKGAAPAPVGPSTATERRAPTGGGPEVVTPSTGRPAGRAAEIPATVEAAGHYRVYLGAAAGVGKTVAMLDEGHRRRRRGTDVVIAFVECHGRYMTEARSASLEVVRRKVIEHRGVHVEEMDLDAVLERRPQVALVDELAHTNVGSCRHDKRWQDVVELLDAGIDVITTVNIQHLESIADTVERITGAPVRERVPDWVVRRADQIELVDSSPEQLRRRMVHGNIYPPEKADYALDHFFRAENLTALRELALRFVADEIEEELVEQLRRRGADVVWETTERIMVGITTAPGTDAIVRRASRMAARLKADLHVVHVTGEDDATETQEGRISDLRRLAYDVGATWHELEANEPAIALIDFARANQITQIVLGSSRRSRWQELASRGAVTRRVTRLAASTDIDVHIIARRRAPGS